MLTETRNKVLIVTTTVLLPLAAATIARMVTNNPDAGANAFYLTALAEPLVFGTAAAITRRRSQRS